MTKLIFKKGDKIELKRTSYPHYNSWYQGKPLTVFQDVFASNGDEIVGTRECGNFWAKDMTLIYTTRNVIDIINTKI